MNVLTWSGCSNVRDLGGLPVEGGGRIPDRVLVRADSLTQLDDDGIRAFDEYGVVRIIDLRAEHEIAAPVHPYAGRDVYRSVPWTDVGSEPEHDRSVEQDLADLYRGSLDRNVRQVATAVRAFLDAPEGPVVVHCAGGKDRTGMLIAVLLETAGVPRDVVVEDYAASATQLGIAEILETLSPEDRSVADRLAWSHPETLTAALEHLDSVYGGAAAYLRDACGLTDDELDAVRHRLAG